MMTDATIWQHCQCQKEVHYGPRYEYLLTGMLSRIILLRSYSPSAGL